MSGLEKIRTDVCMYVYIHIDVYMCIYVHTYICLYMYMYMYIYIYTYIFFEGLDGCLQANAEWHLFIGLRAGPLWLPVEVQVCLRLPPRYRFCG